MGIKHFFHWFKKEFDGNIYKMTKGQNLPVDIDNLMIDMNLRILVYLKILFLNNLTVFTNIQLEVKKIN